ncbi:MAG: hypothetical protein HYX97_03990 [Chloroflexi bacterium]|nr:hypothetical protein [Chloroflexota bacterium]
MRDDLAMAALAASGVLDRREREAAIARLEALSRNAHAHMEMEGRDALHTAEAMFRWLWLTKPVRYQPGGPYQLQTVVKRQVEWRQKTVGNCLGLTVLYNALLQRLGLRVEAVYAPDAARQGPHVFSRLRLDGRRLDIDSSVPFGFGTARFMHAKDRVVWDNQALVAEIYASRGNEALNAGDAALAVRCYRKSLALHPGHPMVGLNMGIALAAQGKVRAAQRALSRASLVGQ